jgi:iron complex transport system substrate-binding protein
MMRRLANGFAFPRRRIGHPEADRRRIEARPGWRPAPQRWVLMRTLLRIVVIVTLLLGVGLTGCGDQAGRNGPTRRVTDDLGREVDVPATPRRIAAVAPFAVEVLMALGHRPVLRPQMDQGAVRPPEARDIATMQVGHGAGPNIEQLVAARPDLAILQPTFRTSIEAIEQQGVPVVVYDIKKVQDVPRTIEAIGELVNERKRAGELADVIRREIAENESM